MDLNNQKAEKKSQGHSYEPLSFFALRAPLMPIEFYLGLSKFTGSSISEMRSIIANNRKVDLALAVGNPSLHDALETVKASEQGETEKLKRKLLRMLIRMSSRSTPFGLYAGVAIGSWSDKSTLSLSDTGAIIRTRFDMELLSKLALSLEPDLLTHLKLVNNPTLSFVGERLYVIERAPLLDQDNTDGISIAATEEIREVIAHAATPITYTELFQAVKNSLEIEDLDLEDMIFGLVENTFLLTNLRPNTFDVDACGRLLEILQAAPDVSRCQRIQARLSELGTELKDFDASVSQDSPSQYKALYKQGSELHNGTNTFQSDMALSLAQPALNRSVAQEVVNVLDLIIKLNNVKRRSAWLQEYKERFFARYEKRIVPLLDVLNPDAGLGLPKQEHASRDGQDNRDDTEAGRQRQKLLSNVVHGAIRDNVLEVELSSALIDQLSEIAAFANAQVVYPASIDVFATMHARSLADIDEGNYRLALQGITPGAAKNIGRFCDLLGEPGRLALVEAAEKEQALNSGKLHCELTSLPRRLRLANVCTVPCVRPYHVALDCWSESASGTLIPVSDLALGFDNDHFFLRSISHQTDLELTAQHLANPTFNSAIAYFLRMISEDRQTNIGLFDWGNLSSANFLPRIRYGKFILARAQWSIQITPSERKKMQSSERFMEWLENWRKRWFVPRHVYLAEADNRLLLDLDDPTQADELHQELLNEQRGTVLLQEALFDGHSWLAGPDGHYTSELVFSFAQTATLASKNVALPSTLVVDQRQIGTSLRLRHPGSDWLYAKIYCGETLRDDIISESLLPFATSMVDAESATSWFFINYIDPDKHIRFRLSGSPLALTQNVYPALCSLLQGLVERGVARTFVVDTYDREIERYGGPDAIDIAEQLFAVDSDCVARIIALESGESFSEERVNICALTIDKLLEALGLDQKEKLSWYKEHARKRSEAGPEYRNRKGSLMQLGSGQTETVPGEFYEIINKWVSDLEPLGAKYRELEKSAQLWQPISTIYRAFVHMHCNRLMGTDLAQEALALALACRRHEARTSTSKEFAQSEIK